MTLTGERPQCANRCTARARVVPEELNAALAGDPGYPAPRYVCPLATFRMPLLDYDSQGGPNARKLVGPARVRTLRQSHYLQDRPPTLFPRAAATTRRGIHLSICTDMRVSDSHFHRSHRPGVGDEDTRRFQTHVRSLPTRRLFPLSPALEEPCLRRTARQACFFLPLFLANDYRGRASQESKFRHI